MKLYHISFKKLKTEKLTPRISNRILTGENCTIPRVCCAKTIEACICGVNHADLIGRLYFVYELLLTDKHVVFDSRQIYQLVPDSLATLECWVLQPVDLKFIGQIEVKEAYQQLYPILSNPQYHIYEKIKWRWVDNTKVQ